MSIINSQPLIGASGNQITGYNLTNSLRFRSSASASLSRTPSAGNRKTWTFSAWIKRGTLQTSSLFTTYTNTDNSVGIFFSGDTLEVSFYETTRIGWVVSNAVFRDPAAWYHLVVSIDTTQATASNRIKVYINGSQITSLSQAIYPNQNADLLINSANQHLIGKQNYPGFPHYFDGYMAEVNFINSQQLTPSSFGETDATTGVWKPKAYSGTYGTNGFYLKFTDVATTSGSNAGLGKDFSGNGNYWTTNNISVTSGATYDSMKDVPTLTDTDTANYCVLNPLDATTPAEVTNGNLSFGGGTNVRGTMGGFGSGKYYYEYTKTNASSSPNFGRCGAVSNTAVLGSMTAAGTVYRSDGLLYENDVNVATYASFTTNDVIGVAINCDSSELSFYKNNTLQGTRSFPSGLTASNVTPALRNNTGQTSHVNFGQRPFAYTPPTGFKALNAFNLPDSTIVAGNKVMDATTYAGNSTARSITNAGAFKPDLVWVKDRTTAGIWNVLFDSVRGAGNQLSSNQTDAELASASSVAGKVSAFNSDGFSVVTGSSSYYSVNQTGDSYVAWQWQAGQGTNTTNTSGSITSTVSVNASAGFSIVSFSAGTTSAVTVGHGLGVAPKLIITKARAAIGNWSTYHASLGATKGVRLNTTDAATTSTFFWNDTAPTSTVFTGYFDTGASIAYCWSEVAGFSKAFSYTGNGSTDGSFVYLGFRPKFVMIKRTDASEQWYINDTSRDTYNLTGKSLRAQDSGAEASTGGASSATWDILSNGFKLRDAGGGTNASGGSYIGIAFAENPFKNSLAR